MFKTSCKRYENKIVIGKSSPDQEIYKNLTFQQHLLAAFSLRLVLIVYGEIQDTISLVPYTDIDYKVITDGSRLIWNSTSPFRRHTFRYSPILGYLMLPNLLVHQTFGKILFSVFDLLIGVLIQKISNEETTTKSSESNNETKNSRSPHPSSIKLSTLLWIYNPFGMIISTRGNGDSIASFFVLLVIYLIQKKPSRNSWYYFFGAGILHGFSIHLRIYPIIFSLTYYLNLSTKLGQFNLIPNKNQISLISGTLASLILLTFGFYMKYDYEFIYETYLYHLKRSDIKHNFSLMFLTQYLNIGEHFDYTKFMISIPKFFLIIYFSLKFSSSHEYLPFCIFSQVFVMVSFNPVITSQYFIWYLTILPICFSNFRNISIKLGIWYFLLWLIVGQGLWLLPAYLLEFKGFNTFNWIGLQSGVFFFINIFILKELINHLNVKKKLK